MGLQVGLWFINLNFKYSMSYLTKEDGVCLLRHLCLAFISNGDAKRLTTSFCPSPLYPHNYNPMKSVRLRESAGQNSPCELPGKNG